MIFRKKSEKKEDRRNIWPSVAFTNSTTFWIAGYNGTILNTTDLGYNWTSYDSVTTNDLTSLSFVNEYTGWVCGMNGTMIKYSVEPPPPPVELTHVAAIPERQEENETI